MLRRYLQLLGIQLKASTLLALQYRYDFLIDGTMSLVGTIAAVVPLFVVFQQRPQIAGWSFPEALIVIGFFVLLQGVLEGAINPSLTSVVEHVRKGTLDFVLLKPADAQFLVSTAKFLPWKVMNLLAGIGLLVYAFVQLDRVPSILGLLAALVLLGASTLLLYSLWIVTVSMAFFFVRVDNLSYFFTSIFDAARWPVSVFRGAWLFLFTFVIPLGVMTTYPAEALLGRLAPATLAYALGGASVFAVIGRVTWLKSIGKYTSASS